MFDLTIAFFFLLSAMIHPCIRSGWFNSFAGVVKRRFASYVKLNLTSGDKQQQQQQKEDASSTVDKRSSPNPASNYGTSASQLPVSSMIYPPSPHILSNDRRHHRSPDPPPRFESLISPPKCKFCSKRNIVNRKQQVQSRPITVSIKAKFTRIRSTVIRFTATDTKVFLYFHFPFNLTCEKLVHCRFY